VREVWSEQNKIAWPEMFEIIADEPSAVTSKNQRQLVFGMVVPVEFEALCDVMVNDDSATWFTPEILPLWSH